MVVMFSTKNYEEFTLVMKALEGSKQPIFVVFTGTNDVTGTSWCPDCVKAEYFITTHITQNKDLVYTNFVYAQVGNREEWKDNKENPFKLDKNIQLQFLPTILKWGTMQKLQVEECVKPDLLNMMFEDTEDIL